MEFIPLYFLLSIIEPILLLNNLYINPFATKSRPKRYSFASQSLLFCRLKESLLLFHMTLFL